MKQWQKIVGIIAFGTISFGIGCTRSIDYTDGEDVFYSEFPKEVQNTLIWRGENTKISIEDTIIAELPDVICYNSDYSFLYTEWETQTHGNRCALLTIITKEDMHH